jgi:hypothetical protein
MNRGELWVNRYNEVVNKARANASSDPKLGWQLGSTKTHCKDCQNLSGKVYRGSTWTKWNVAPQSENLECKGFKCRCSLSPSASPVTKGRPPMLSRTKEEA